MKTHLIIPLSALCCMLSLLSCNEADLDIVQDLPDVQTEAVQTGDESSFVAPDKAMEVAGIFFGSQGFVTKSNTPKEVEGTPIEIKGSDGTPLMYVINYQDGGFVIVSATTDYYPILAFSDENEFYLTEDMGGVSLWLDEIEGAVADSESMDASTQSEIQALWNSYESGEIAPMGTLTKSSSQAAIQACLERCYELEAQYSSQGWLFAPLLYAEQVFDDAGYSSTYDEICYSANFNNSALDCSVIGWRMSTLEEQVGPLLSTEWHQGAPFNNLCDGSPAGCAAVAVAQVMKYYHYPQQMTLDGTTFSWNTIPVTPSSSSSQAELMKYIGEAINTYYFSSFSFTTPGDLVSGMPTLLYTAQQEDYIGFDTINYMFNHQKPIIMLGNSSNFSWTPGAAQYIGDSHYWVCDGVKESTPNYLEYFTEWQPNGNGTFVTGWNSVSNPGVLHGVATTYFSMNWGWQNGAYNGWYFNASPASYNFEHSRVNFYISKIQ